MVWTLAKIQFNAHLNRWQARCDDRHSH